MNIVRETLADGVVQLVLAGELDLASVDLLQESVEKAIMVDRPRRLIVDLAKVTFCDATGVQALLDARLSAADRGISFQATNPRGVTRRVMQITGVLSVLG